MNYIFPVRAMIYFENPNMDYHECPQKDICERVSDVCLYPIRGFGRSIDKDDNVSSLGLGRRILTVLSMTLLLPLFIVPTLLGLTLLVFSTAHEKKCEYTYCYQNGMDTWSLPSAMQPECA